MTLLTTGCLVQVSQIEALLKVLANDNHKQELNNRLPKKNILIENFLLQFIT